MSNKCNTNTPCCNLIYFDILIVQEMSTKLIMGGAMCCCSCVCLMFFIGFIGYVYMKTNVFGNNPMCTDSLPGNCITTDGLIGMYDASEKSYKKGKTEWKDLSGKKNHAQIKPTCKIDKDDGGWVTGKQEDWVVFPEGILLENDDYTLVHVSRYNGKNATRERIFVGKKHTDNWLSGFWKKRTGVSHQGGISWITEQDTKKANKEPLISIQHRGAYRTDNYEMVEHPNADSAVTPNELGINIWTNSDNNAYIETSDWAVGMVLIYNRRLKESEVNVIVQVLAAKYKVELEDVETNSDDDD